MAKKRAKKKQKDVKKTYELPGGWWRQIFALLMIVCALFLVITWFGEGGSALNAIHDGAIWLLGLGAYFLPMLLVYLAVKIFQSEDNQLSAWVWVASILIVAWISGMLGIPCAAGAEKFLGLAQSGGVLGEYLNKFVMQILAPEVAVFIYLVLIFITALFILQVSPLSVFKSVAGATKKKKAADAEKASAPNGKKIGELEIKINSGVPVMEPSAPISVGKVSAAKPAAPVAEEKALVSVSNPNWKMPTIDLLEKRQSPADAGNIQQNANIIHNTFAEFGIEVEMEGANIGPKVTQYMMHPPSGVNLAKIVARDKELALNLAIDKVRIEAPIPGTSSVGVEIPNIHSADVSLRSILESSEWKKSDKPLTFAVGQDISGKAVVADLAKMPHLLIAGTTGSGKSVMSNSLITSLIYRNSPSDLKLIIVDPKQVEMVQYADIPHLLTPIITAPEKTLSALKWSVGEMERRYSLMAAEKVKNIVDYNEKMAKAGKTVGVPDEDGNEQQHQGGKMPYIVILIDEMADLMMLAGKDLETLIVRIAQKGRAAGMHLVLATQRPEAKVITGLIKSNVPGRIAFAVGSQLDSRIMLDQGGAEKLLGKGDMLLLTTEMMGKARRIQGAWASDKDIDSVTGYLKEQAPPDYNDEVVSQAVQIKGMGPVDGGAFGDLGRKFDPNDPVVRKAIEIMLAKGSFSTSMLQTYLGKGHGFVSGLAVWLEELGVIGEANGNKPRDVLISSMDEFDQLANA